MNNFMYKHGWAIVWALLFVLLLSMAYILIMLAFPVNAEASTLDSRCAPGRAEYVYRGVTNSTVCGLFGCTAYCKAHVGGSMNGLDFVEQRVRGKNLRDGRSCTVSICRY